MFELCLHSPIRLHGVLLNSLSTGATLPYLYRLLHSTHLNQKITEQTRYTDIKDCSLFRDLLYNLSFHIFVYTIASCLCLSFKA
jgi:hypothetical protein